jgi:ribosomal protein L22
MLNLDKKAAGIMLKILLSARLNGTSQGLQENRLYIKEVICMKGILMKQIDIKGRSKMGIIKVPKC